MFTDFGKSIEENKPGEIVRGVAVTRANLQYLDDNVDDVGLICH